MEHAVHLAAGHFIRTVSPTSSRSLINKFKKALKNTNSSEALDLDGLDAELAGMGLEDAIEDDNSELGDADTANAVGKALTLVKQVYTSSYVCSN